MATYFVFFRRTLLLAGLLPGILLPACKERVTFREMPLGLKPDTELTAHNGKRERLVDHLKTVNLLFFGFTRCPDFCPMTLHRLPGGHHLHLDDEQGARAVADCFNPFLRGA